MTVLNRRPILQAVPLDARHHNTLHRALNLSWSERLPEGNRITEGRWFGSGDRGKPLISVEAGMARALGLKLGDRLSFRIGSDTLTATIVSLRKLRWDSFRPNFYVLFPPAVLERFPATWMTSFYLPPGKEALLSRLVRNFPATTLLELEPIMKQVQQIIGQLTLAVEYVLLFVLAAGILVLLASLHSSLDERLHESALLRALGARSRQLRQAHLAEFLTLGLLAGLLATLGAELFAGFMHSRVLQLEPVLHPWLWLATPLLGALLVGMIGLAATRQVLKQSPLAILRRS